MRKHMTELHGDPRVDMSPMLDVIFILLIFFLVTATFIHERGFRYDGEEGKAPISDKGAAIIFTIEPNNRILYDGREISEAALIPIISRLNVHYDEAALIIRSAYTASMGTMVSVYDKARLAGIDASRIRFKTVEG